MVMSAMENDSFPARFPNIFVDYPLGQMRVGDKLWNNWNKGPIRLWETQLHYAVFYASSACVVSSAHLNYTKHPMIRSVYRFHVYYQVRRILKKLQTEIRTWGFWCSFRPLLHHTSSAHNSHSAPELISLSNCIGLWGKASSGAIWC